MLNRVLFLGIFFVLGVHCYGGLDSFSNNPLSHSQWNWKLPDLFTSETRRAYVEDEGLADDSEGDREPLAPDYKDPAKPKDDIPQPKQRPDRIPYNPSVLHGGVVDVEAGNFGFPQIPDSFGFASSFGNRNPGGIFGLGGFFEPFPERTPWWKGANVCIEREETTDDEDTDVEPNQNKSDVDKAPNFFSTSISLSNCQETPLKYECTTKINNHGVVKTFVVRYKCCYGFKRSDDSNGCTKKIELLPLLSTIEATGGKEFRNMIRATGLDNKFTTENFTVFVPTDETLSEFTERMVEFNQVDLNVAATRRRRQAKNSVSSTDLVLNHALSGFVDLSDIINEEVLYSANNNNTIRFNIYPTRNYGKMLTANCYKLVKKDNLATNGIVHVIDGVLNPVTQSVLEIVAEHPDLSHFYKVLQSTDLAKNFKANGHYTVFAPTNEAFNKLTESTKQKLFQGDACASTILKHHIVAHTVCSCAIVGNATTHNVVGEILSLQRSDDDKLLFENSAKIVKTDIVGTNGVVHLIDVVVMPDSALYVSQALKNENFTKFQSLIDKAELTEDIDSFKNITLFAPSDEAFDDPKTVKLLEEIKDDKEKLKELVLYHTTEGKLESCNMNNNALLKTKNNEKTLRLNLYSTLPVFTNIINKATVNCVRLTGYDEKSCGSVIHEVNKILIPPTKTLLEEINSDENYSTLSKLIEGTDIENILKDNTQTLTLLAPTNEAFDKILPSEIKEFMQNKQQASLLIKNHILTEVLCCSGIGPQTFGFSTLIPTLNHQHQSIGRSGDQIKIGGASVINCDNVATNGVVHKVNKVLIPQQSRSPGFGFFLFDF